LRAEQKYFWENNLGRRSITQKGKEHQNESFPKTFVNENWTKFAEFKNIQKMRDRV